MIEQTDIARKQGCDLGNGFKDENSVVIKHGLFDAHCHVVSVAAGLKEGKREPHTILQDAVEKRDL